MYYVLHTIDRVRRTTYVCNTHDARQGTNGKKRWMRCEWAIAKNLTHPQNSHERKTNFCVFVVRLMKWQCHIHHGKLAVHAFIQRAHMSARVARMYQVPTMYACVRVRVSSLPSFYRLNFFKWWNYERIMTRRRTGKKILNIQANHSIVSFRSLFCTIASWIERATEEKNSNL